MIYPPFLKPGDRIGICAPSAGIPAEKWEKFDRSLSRMREAGYRLRETPSVRSGGLASADPATRAAELNDLLRNPDIHMVWCATGGDILVSMLPFVDWQAAVAQPKWVQGYSDPTSLLYALTTCHDVATVYGGNAGNMDGETLLPHQQYNLSLLGGAVTEQHSFACYESPSFSGEWNGRVYWQTPNGPVNAKGRLLGGCMECLLDILGTPFDGTADFLKRYAADGVIWYFDVFALTAEQVHNALWHLKQCGWFATARAVMLGRVLFPGGEMSYREAAAAVLGDTPLVLEADVGHVPPRMTVINGALATLQAAEGKGSLTMELV